MVFIHLRELVHVLVYCKVNVDSIMQILGVHTYVIYVKSIGRNFIVLEKLISEVEAEEVLITTTSCISCVA